MYMYINGIIPCLRSLYLPFTACPTHHPVSTSAVRVFTSEMTIPSRFVRPLQALFTHATYKCVCIFFTLVNFSDLNILPSFIRHDFLQTPRRAGKQKKIREMNKAISFKDHCTSTFITGFITQISSAFYRHLFTHLFFQFHALSSLYKFNFSNIISLRAKS